MQTENEVLAPTGVRLDKDFGADIDLLVSLVPDKMAFKIGEVSEMLGLKNHVLRYWESEFAGLKPKKSNQNQRMYTIKEIEMLLLVRKFLYVDKFSISGARKALRSYYSNKNKHKAQINNSELEAIKLEIEVLMGKVSAAKKVLNSDI